MIGFVNEELQALPYDILLIVRTHDEDVAVQVASVKDDEAVGVEEAAEGVLNINILIGDRLNVLEFEEYTELGLDDDVEYVDVFLVDGENAPEQFLGFPVEVVAADSVGETAYPRHELALRPHFAQF